MRLKTRPASMRLSGQAIVSLTFAMFLGTPCAYADEAQAADRPENNVAGDAVVVKVGAAVITKAEFEQTLGQAMRQKFYHFKPPEEQRDAFRREVAEDLITRKMLLQEAARRQIKADSDQVKKQLDGYEKRYQGRPGWEERGPALLASVKTSLEQSDQLRQLEEAARQVGEPSEADIRAFYDANQEKFTEPPRQRLSLILLRVDPSSPRAVWDEAMAEGRRLLEQLRGGADFAEMARTHSGDLSAAKGGDMGYLHQGMLSENAQTVVDGLKLGEISEPIRMLEGIALFRLDERTEEQLRQFDEVRDRAEQLWRKDRSDAAWTTFKERLRKETTVEILDPTLAPPS